MPGVLKIGTPNPGLLKGVKAESITLLLPSDLDARDRDAVCLGGVANCEKELRFAQLEDSLNDLRRARRTRHGLITFHKVQLAGQGQKTQTKSQAAMKTIQDRIDRCVRRYRVARDALLRLDPRGEWTKLYLPLTDNDNRGPMKELVEIASSDGRYTPSWIWCSGTTTVSREEVNEDMRAEWAQCMARAERWEEEVTLLQEEMRRVVQFLQWRSDEWFTKVDVRLDAVASAVHSGLSAYANKQASIFHNLAVRFCQCWRSVLITLSLPHNWATEFLETHEKPLSNPDFEKRKPAKGSPTAHLHVKSPALAATATNTSPLPPGPEIIDHEAHSSDIDSDVPSEDDDSVYDSGGSSSD
jgi:hypothetical protein